MVARPWRLLVLGSWFVVFMVVNGVIRFGNPALTETQLFLNFWPVWLLFVVGVYLTYLWVVRPWRKR